MKKRYMRLIILMGFVILLMGLYIVKINTGSNMEATEENQEETIEDSDREVYKGIELADDEEVSLMHGTYERLDPRDDIRKIPELDEIGGIVQTERFAEGNIFGGSYMDPHGEDYKIEGPDGEFYVDELTVLMDTEFLVTRDLNRFNYGSAHIDIYDSLDVKKIDNMMYRVSGIAFYDDDMPVGAFDIELDYDFGIVNSWIDYK